MNRLVISLVLSLIFLFGIFGCQSREENSYEKGKTLLRSQSFINNEDGTITDNITNLTWEKTPDVNKDTFVDAQDKLTYNQVLSYCQNLTLGDFTDWRVPNIKALYSLMDFSQERTLFFQEENKEALWASSSFYRAYEDMLFTVNFKEGTLNGSWIDLLGEEKSFYVQCVRGEENYGENMFFHNDENTTLDLSTNLIWQKGDSETPLDWESARNYCSNLKDDGYFKWRVPSAKELQSIVDYTSTPDTTGFAALDREYFFATPIINENGDNDYGVYWSGTEYDKNSAVVISFGRDMQFINNYWIDLNGAGSQRKDLKNVKNRNFVRCVREM